jgi:hypothetical protein
MSESHDASIGEAYAKGMTLAREGKEPTDNPYYEVSRQHIACASGYRDEKAWLASNGKVT